MVTKSLNNFLNHLLRSMINANKYDTELQNPDHGLTRTSSSFLHHSPQLFIKCSLFLYSFFLEKEKKILKLFHCFALKDFVIQVMTVASTVPRSNVYLSVYLATIQPLNQPTAPLTGYLLCISTVQTLHALKMQNMQHYPKK